MPNVTRHAVPDLTLGQSRSKCASTQPTERRRERVDLPQASRFSGGLPAAGDFLCDPLGLATRPDGRRASQRPRWA